MSRAQARAPVRVDPAGGGTDAPPFSVEHGGWVLNMAVARYAYATAQRLPPGEGVILYSMDLERGAVADSVGALSSSKDLEFVRGFVRRLVPEGDSLLLVTESDVPPGGGLGGSGALGVAIVAAIDRAYGRERAAVETAALANEVERQDLGYPGGSQDSYAAALGGINLLEYRKGGGTVPHPRLNVTEDMRLALEYSSLLVYTGAAHVSGSIHEDIRNSYAQEDSPTVAAMMDLRQEALTMAKALERGDEAAYVRALSASCAHLYRLHGSCDSEEHRRYFKELDDVILGGKTCGAGGGGFLLVHTRPGKRRECILRAESMGAMVWPMTIDFRGVESWTAPGAPPEEVERYRELARAPSRRAGRRRGWQPLF